MHRGFKRKDITQTVCVNCNNPDLMIGRAEENGKFTFYLICDKCDHKMGIPSEDVSKFRVYCQQCKTEHSLTDVAYPSNHLTGESK